MAIRPVKFRYVYDGKIYTRIASVYNVESDENMWLLERFFPDPTSAPLPGILVCAPQEGFDTRTTLDQETGKKVKVWEELQWSVTS